MRPTILAAIVAWLLTPMTALAAGDSQVERASLAGLTPISIVVEDLAPIAQTNGLSTSALQSEIERRVRQAGIIITPDADAYLFVHVTVADPGSSLPLPYFVDVSIMQEVTLPRGVKTRTLLQCETWGLSSIGLVSGSQLRTAVVSRVNEFVDQFVSAYRAANPKP